MNKNSLNFKMNYFLSLMLITLVISIGILLMLFKYTDSFLNKSIKSSLPLLIELKKVEYNLYSAFDVINNHNLTVSKQREEITSKINELNKSIVFFEDNKFEDKRIKEFKVSVNSLDLYCTKYLENYTKNNELDIKKSLTNFDSFNLLKRAALLKDIEDINTLFRKDLFPTINNLNNLLIQVNQNLNTSFNILRFLRLAVIGCLITLLFLILKHAININKNLLKYIVQINSKIENINDGKGSLSLDLIIPSNDELSSIADNFNTFEKNLFLLIKNIKNGAFTIQQSVEILNTYNDNLVKKSEIQNKQLDSINSNLVEMKTVINVNNDNTNKLNKLAKKTKKITEIIAIESENLKNTLDIIFTSSEKIEKISTSIEDLSFQTTILSLNSAVESTRVQTGAKSFDVISNEIHKLSTIGKIAAKEIKNLSSENKLKIDESAFYLTNTLKLINSLTENILKISSLLDELSSSAKTEENEISFISSSLKEIKLSTHQTNTIAKDTLSLNELLNVEALNFLETLKYFDENINEKQEPKNYELETILSEEEKNEILAILEIKKNNAK